MAVIRLHKSMSVRKKDDSVVTWYSRAENEFGANWKGWSLHERDLRAT
jgi:hypothetical protein